MVSVSVTINCSLTVVVNEKEIQVSSVLFCLYDELFRL